MATPIHFTLLQKEPIGPTTDQLKRAFKTFINLTDADAVRLAVGAHGILMKHLGQDTARALQLALQAEGVGVAMVAENNLPNLPEAQSLNQLEPWPQALTVYDPLGRPVTIAWPDVALVAAGAAQHLEFNKTQTELIRRQHQAAAGARTNSGATGPKIESGSQLLLELLLSGGAVRYQIDAAEFKFKRVIDRPGLSLEEKFIWLVREICHHATHATLNSGARSLHQGGQIVPVYPNRRLLDDEMVWLLWRSAGQTRRQAP